MTVRKKGDKYQLVSSDGRVLGTHPTRSEAQKQEAAVNVSKARAAGHRIPNKKRAGG